MSKWKPIDTAPYQKVIEVRNPKMTDPVRATRGWVTPEGTVHGDPLFCTTVYTPHPYFPTFAGDLVIPTEWREVETPCVVVREEKV
jgi:hypothetical protein